MEEIRGAAVATNRLKLRRNFTEGFRQIRLARVGLRRMLSRCMWGSSRFDQIVADVQRSHADYIRTELDIGLTFLDIAATTRDLKHSQRCVGIAIEALRTADRFFREVQLVDSDDDLYQRREQLRQRLRGICG
jgi:hypothetical protein